jgi:hypothetical protein
VPVEFGLHTVSNSPPERPPRRRTRPDRAVRVLAPPGVMDVLNALTEPTTPVVQRRKLR